MQYTMDVTSAIDYYVESYIFSKWVTDTFGDLEEKSLVEIASESLAKSITTRID